MPVPYRLLSGLALAALAACANTPPPDTSCGDLSGTYINTGTPEGVLLSDVLQLPSAARTVTIDGSADRQTLSARAGTARKTLREGTDFSCSGGRIELAAPQRTASAVPLLASTEELTRYALERAGHTLLGHRTVTTSAVAYGIPMRGPPHPAPDVGWQAADR